jgi:hypothetical protein
MENSQGWLIVCLSIYPRWKKLVEEELKQFIMTRGAAHADTMEEKLKTISYEEWEEGLPNVDLTIKETLRVYQTGTSFRANLGSKCVSV